MTRAKMTDSPQDLTYVGIGLFLGSKLPLRPSQPQKQIAPEENAAS